jgi:glycosyltransferase involved in cell wall biosynthesis
MGGRDAFSFPKIELPGSIGIVQISFSATNPCHMYPTALAAARRGAAVTYYSGYPAWKLRPESAIAIRAHALRTQVVYGLLRLRAFGLRPPTKALFRWQDRGFDRWVGRQLGRADFVHAMPGQALETFRRARQLGVRTVLNHATGPLSEWVRIMRPEYDRVGMRLEAVCPYDERYFRRETEEYRLADYHCVASGVVRDQLIGLGIEPGRIWRVPYGADPVVFSPPATRVRPPRFRIVFAGQVGLRKGIRTLLEAVFSEPHHEWEMEFCGAVLPEAETDLAAYHDMPSLRLLGHLAPPALAARFREASALVLPSIEEGFGLVVPQALSTGLPCIVSDRVGGKDLIRHRENGSVFPAGDAAALRKELAWWAEGRDCPPERHDWSEAGKMLLEASGHALMAGVK